MQDVPKAGLMGFADVAPDAAKVLVVHFTHEKQAFMVTLEEQVDVSLFACHGKYISADMIFKMLVIVQEGATLPGSGNPVQDKVAAQLLKQQAADLKTSLQAQEGS